MNIKVRSSISVLVSLMLVFGLLTACGSGGGTPNETTQVASSSAVETTIGTTAAETESSLPITKEPITLKFLNFLDTWAARTLKTYNDAPWVQEAEKRMGIHIEFIHPKDDQAIGLIMASGDYPDIIEAWDGYFPGGAAKAAADGIFIPLNDLIEKNCPNITEYYKQVPLMKKVVTYDDGNIYGFPMNAPDDGKGLAVCGYLINKEWIDKLGLSIPTTLDEWETVLKAFKEQDPNGNGKADEIPFILRGMSHFKWYPMIFGLWGMSSYDQFYQVDGVVKYSPLQPEYKEGLAIMNKWYKNGWLDNDFVTTNTSEAYSQKAESGLVGAQFDYATNAKKVGNTTWVACPYPTLKKGEQPLVGQIYSPYIGGSVYISSKNKYPVESVKWLDYWYGHEGAMLVNYGVEGQSYTMVDGKPKFTDLIFKNPDGLDKDTAACKYSGLELSWPKLYFNAGGVYREFNSDQPEALEALNLFAKPLNQVLLPPVKLTLDEEKESTDIMTEVYTYMDEMVAKFIMGEEPLENYDKFVDRLKQMGIEKAIQIRQAAFDRFNATK